MAAPRVTIDALPEKSALAGTEWFLVQDGSVSKKVAATNVNGGTGGSGGGGLTNGDKGDIVVSALGESLLFDNNVVTPAARTLLDDVSPTAMRTTLGLGNVNNTADANKPTFTTSVAGLVPPPFAVAGAFLKDDGTWGTPVGGGGGITTEDAVDAVNAAFQAGTHTNITVTYNDAANSISLAASGGGGGGLTNGDKGDIIVGSLGDSLTFDPTVVTAAAKTLLDDTTIAAMKTTLGLGNVDNTADASKPIFTVSTRGLVPAPSTATGAYLKDDGTWATLPNAAVGGVYPFTYAIATTEPPTGNQLRGNVNPLTGSTKLWVMETTTDGLNVAVGLGRIKAGYQLFLQDWGDASRYAIFNVTADAIDRGAYWEVAVTLSSSAGTMTAGKIGLQSLSAAQANTLFSTTSTAAGLTPGSNGVDSSYFLNGTGLWSIPAGGGGGGGLTSDQVIDTIQAASSATAPIVLTNDVPLQTIKYALSGTLAQFNAAVTDADIQPANTNLTSISAITAPANNDTMQYVAGTWASRTPTQAKATLAIVPADVTGLGALATKSTVANPDLATMPANTVKMNNTAGTATPTDVPIATMKTALGLPAGASAAAATTITTTAPLTGSGDLSGPLTLGITTFTTSVAGTVPAPVSATGRYLRDNGTWQTVTGTTGPAGIVQQSTAPADTTVLWADTSQVGIEENARILQTGVTGSTYTLVLADRGKLILANSASSQVVTVPTNATAAFVIGTQLDLVQYGAGPVSVIGASGVTINGLTTALSLRTRYSATSLIKTATNTWICIGDMA